MIRAISAQRFTRFLGATIPFDLTFLLMVLSMLPWQIPFTGLVRPTFVLVAVFYWVLHVPFSLPIWAVFILGLLHDILGLAPVGAGLLTFIATFGITALLRPYLVNAPIPTILAGLFLVSFAGRFIGWLLSCYTLSTLIDPRPTLFVIAVDLVSYLPLAYLFARIQQFVFPSRAN